MSDIKLQSFLDYIYLDANTKDNKYVIFLNDKDVSDDCYWAHVYKEPGIEHYAKVRLYVKPIKKNPKTGEPYFVEITGVVRWEHRNENA